MNFKFQILFFLIGFQLVFSQNWKATDSIQLDFQGEITDFEVDDFNNLYFIKNSIELNKIDLKSKKTYRFSNQNILEKLNTQNILQLSIQSGFFKIVVLDNQLTPLNEPIEFPMDGTFLPTLTDLVDNNFLWGFDPVIQRLVLWNFKENKIYRQSVILNEKTADAYFSDLIYKNNQIYLIGPKKILQFDEFANLEKVIPFDEYQQIYLKNHSFYYSKNKQLYQLELNSKASQKIPLDLAFDFFSMNQDFLFVLKDKLVYIYELQKP